MADYTGNVCNPDTERQDCNAKNPGGSSPPTHVWNAALRVCQPVDIQCPEGHSPIGGVCTLNDSCPVGFVLAHNGACKKSDDECPPGNIKSPSGQCLPGEGQCAQGEARRPNGTCGKDDDGDGKSDDDDDNPNNDSTKETFAGGDTCNAPPSCSGSPILCGQARIQWRIECNTRKNRNISGGACGSAPVCTGEKCDAMEYSQLIMQWRTACALEKQSGDAVVGGQPDWTKVTGDGTDGAGNDPEGPLKSKSFNPGERLDSGGFFSGGGTCPQLGTLNLPFGKTFDMDSVPWFCDLLFMTRMFLTLLGSFIGIGILLGWRL